MGVRHRGRELAFQILFQTDQTGDKVNAVIARFQDMKHANAEAAAFAEALAVGAFGDQPAIDAQVSAAADHWKLARLLSVDRALLRLGAYELGQAQGTPTEVILDECIDLAKTYGGEDSASFVNGVLDRLARRLRPLEEAGDPEDAGRTKSKGKTKSAAKLRTTPIPKSAAHPKSTPIPKSTAIPKSRPKTKSPGGKP
jgi:N utilization substance protein B